MRRPHNLQSFRQLMFEQDNFFVESALIRYEYTYFVCFNMLPEHAQYFGRPSEQSRMSISRSSAFPSQRSTMNEHRHKGAAGHKHGQNILGDLSRRSSAQSDRMSFDG